MTLAKRGKKETNKGCAECDKFGMCNKKVKLDKKFVIAKEQTKKDMECIHKAHALCHKCGRFQKNKCARWQYEGDKLVEPGNLISCPDKTKKTRKK